MSALAALLLVLILPSAAGVVLLSGATREDRPPASPELVAARGVACGLAAWLLGSGILARTVGLTAPWAWTWSGVIGAASLVVLLLPRHRPQLRAVLEPVGRRLAAVSGLTLLVYAPLGYAVVSRSWSPLGSTPWYYYGLARQVAEVGAIPASSTEFGTTTSFLTDYHVFTTGTAALLVQDPGSPMTVLTIVTLVGVLLLGLGAVALTSALGAGRIGALLAVPVAVASGIAPIRLAGYRPEGFALGLALLLVAVGVDWLRHRDWRPLVAGALLAAILSQVHGIAAVTAGVMLAAAAVTFLIRGPRREQLVRTGLAFAALLAAVVVTGLAFREASGTATSGGLVDQGGLADPTWRFYVAARAEAPSMPPSNARMALDSLEQLYAWSQWWIVPALLLAGYGLWRRRRDPVARQVVAFTVIALVGLAAVALVFMLGWKGYVPRRTGASRLVLEASLLTPPLIAIGLECLARLRWSWRGREYLPVLRRRLLVLLTVLSLFGVGWMIKVCSWDIGQAPSRADVALWRSLPVTSRDVVLANGYTEGFIPDLTGASGLLDGRAPYTFGDQMRRANSLFAGAQSFFDDPSQHWDFLAEHGVTWVVVGDPDAHSLGTGNVWDTPTSLGGLESCPGLERVASNGSLTAFRVTDPGPHGC
jgi:hypothetical protein